MVFDSTLFGKVSRPSICAACKRFRSKQAKRKSSDNISWVIGAEARWIASKPRSGWLVTILSITPFKSSLTSTRIKLFQSFWNEFRTSVFYPLGESIQEASELFINVLPVADVIDFEALFVIVYFVQNPISF